MCNTCNGTGRVTSSPYPGLTTFERCTCLKDMTGYPTLEQQLQVLDQKIEDFEKGMSYGEGTLDG